MLVLKVPRCQYPSHLALEVLLVAAGMHEVTAGGDVGHTAPVNGHEELVNSWGFPTPAPIIDRISDRP